jgi:predicted secreted protein
MASGMVESGCGGLATWQSRAEFDILCQEAEALETERAELQERLEVPPHACPIKS